METYATSPGRQGGLPLVPRPRLTERLDRLLAHAAVWIAGPPGSGKSTLVRECLRTRDSPRVSYTADRTHRAVADVLRALAASARGVPTGDAGWEERVADCLTDASAARFFALLRGTLPAGTLLILEDVDRLAPPVRREILSAACGELNGALPVLATAIETPGAELIQLIARQQLAVIDADDLQFTREEIAALLPAPLAPFVDAIVATTEGWITGVVLLAAEAKGEEAQRLFDIPAVQDRLAAYFGGEVMPALPPDVRALALQLAPFPAFTRQMAVAWCGDPAAADAMDELARRLCFVRRSRHAEGGLRFHPMFREYMLAQLRISAGDAAWRATLAEAARVLAAGGDDIAAAMVHVESGAWADAAAALERRATAMRRGGDRKTLLELARKLPREALQSRPRLCFEAGCAAMQCDREPFTPWFELAFTAFEANGDAAGAAVTAAAAIRATISDFSNMHTLERWAARLKPGVDTGASSAAADDLLLLSAGVVAVTHFLPTHGYSDETIAAHVKALVDAVMGDGELPDVNIALLGAESLLEQYAHTSQRSRTEQLALRCAAWLVDPRLSPLLRARWNFWLANEFRFLDRPDALPVYVAESRRIGAEHRLAWIEFHTLRNDLRERIYGGDYPGARAMLEHMQTLLDFERPLDIGDYYHVKGWVALLEGDAAPALEDFRIARDAAERGCYNVAVNFYRSMEAYALIALEDEPAAIAILEELAYQSTERYQAVQRGLIALARAWRARREDEGEYRSWLQQGFAAAREHNLIMLFRPLPAVVARLAGDALEHAIEREFVLRVVAERKLPAPPAAGRAWPWPIKVLTLGTFEILLDDKPLVSSGKAQRKLLDLLKVLIALGGQDVAADRLVDALWPDPDDAGSRGALDVAITRLRKLLGINEAILVTEGKVSLNRGVLWVDALALEQRLRQWQQAGAAAFQQADVMLRPNADKLFAAYRGHFLNRDGDAAWLLPTRERLWSAMGRILERMGGVLQQQRAWDQAAELYRRATELDLLTESFYRNLMICYRESGRVAEAIDVYRRCRQNLSVILGIAPSAETEAVHQSLRR
jgi:LuxR family transcriptional regulator, maltose regulon positive regulatory protein